MLDTTSATYATTQLINHDQRAAVLAAEIPASAMASAEPAQRATMPWREPSAASARDMKNKGATKAPLVSLRTTATAVAVTRSGLTAILESIPQPLQSAAGMGAVQLVGVPPCGVTMNVQPEFVMVTPECGVFARMAAEFEGARTDA